MKLYHGSNVLVQSPDVGHSREKIDFGRGFYVTPILSQAVKWADRFRDGGDSAFVSVYDFDETVLPGLKFLDFPEHDGDWLDFIVSCRLGNDTTDLDVIRGGVANDRVFDTCELYFRGLIAKDTAIERLKFVEPNLQLCFKNNRVIKNYLFYCEGIDL